MHIVVEAINSAFREKEKIIPFLIENVRSSLEQTVDDRVAVIDTEIRKLQQQPLAGSGFMSCENDIGTQIRMLREEKLAIQNEEASVSDRTNRMEELKAFLDEQSCELKEYDESFVKALIEKITVYDHQVNIEFKSEIEIQIDE